MQKVHPSRNNPKFPKVKNWSENRVSPGHCTQGCQNMDGGRLRATCIMVERQPLTEPNPGSGGAARYLAGRSAVGERGAGSERASDAERPEATHLSE